MPAAVATRTRGQSLVEFALGVPLFMLLLLGMVEFGFVFTHHIGLEYASREGARMGSALASGTATVACTDVDTNVIAALQRVVTSPGSQINVGNISQIQIYSANASGDPIGSLDQHLGARHRSDGRRRRPAVPQHERGLVRLPGRQPEQRREPRLDRREPDLPRTTS